MEPVEPVVEVGPVPVAWWRFCLMIGIGVALYLVTREVTDLRQTHPALLVPAVAGGAAAGWIVASVKVRALRGRVPEGRSVPTATARAAVVGLSGLGLILAQTLADSMFEWMSLGLVALMASGAAHAWVLQRYVDRGSAA